MEEWDAYTADEIKTGDILIRGDKISNGLYHLVCEVLVRHKDGSYLLMLRSLMKPNYPGYYEASAGGAALKGEDAWTCIERELKEETGIECKEFIMISHQIYKKEQCIFYSFICEVDCKKEAVLLQAGETEGYQWLSESEFCEFVNSGKMISNQKKRYLPYLKKMNYLIGG